MSVVIKTEPASPPKLEYNLSDDHQNFSEPEISTNLDDSEMGIATLFPRKPLATYGSAETDDGNWKDNPKKKMKIVSNARERRRREGLNKHYHELEELLDFAFRSRTEKVTVLSGAIRKLRELQQENEALRQENRDMKTNIAIITDCVTKAFLYGVPPFSGTGSPGGTVNQAFQRQELGPSETLGPAPDQQQNPETNAEMQPVEQRDTPVSGARIEHPDTSMALEPETTADAQGEFPRAPMQVVSPPTPTDMLVRTPPSQFASVASPDLSPEGSNGL